MDRKFDESHLQSLTKRLAANFIHGLFFSYQGMDNRDFFRVISSYLSSNLEGFNKLELLKLLDMFKYNE